jgi:hypothetical protein
MAEYYVVRYGQRGEQLAKIIREDGRRLVVRKWRRNSARWTAEVTTSWALVLRPAGPEVAWIDADRARAEAARTRYIERQAQEWSTIARQITHTDED